MGRWIILAVLVVVITAAATAFQFLPGPKEPEPYYPVPPTGPGGRPRAHVDKDTTIHFGSRSHWAKIEGEWTITNEGDADLVLTKGPPACSCTIANFENGTDTITIKPKGQTKVHLSWTTKDYTDRYYKPATILTNDAEHPEFKFAAEGMVYPAVDTYPRESTVNFQTISNDEADHRNQVAVFSADRPDVKITKLITSKPGLVDAEPSALTPEECARLKVKRGYRIVIHVRSGMPIGEFREELVIATDHPKQPEVKLTVTGTMVGPITAVPARLRLQKVESRRGAQARIDLHVRGQRATRFEVVKVPDRFQVEITPPDPAGKTGNYRLTVSILPGIPPGQINDRIVLKTDHPQAGQVIVPVDLYVVDSGAVTQAPL